MTAVYHHHLFSLMYLALKLNTLTSVSAAALWDMQLTALKMRSLTVQTRTQSTYFLTCLREAVSGKCMVDPGLKSLKLAFCHPVFLGHTY